MSIDWNQLSKDAEAAFSPVPPGDYNALVTESSAVVAGTGKPMVKVKFRILDGPHANRVLFNNFVVSADNATAMGFFFRHMRVFGMDAAFFAAQPSMEQIADRLLNQQVVITVNLRKYQGEDQNGVAGIKPSLGGGLGGVPSALPGVPAASSVPPAPAPAPAPAPPAPVPPAPAPEAAAPAAPEEPF